MKNTAMRLTMPALLTEPTLQMGLHLTSHSRSKPSDDILRTVF